MRTRYGMLNSGPTSAGRLEAGLASLGALLAAGALLVLATQVGAGWRAPALALTGLALGFVLFQSTFGFAGSFRAALERRDFSGFRAQAFALALASIVFFPILGAGQIFGWDVYGFGAPIGVSFAIGAAMFGVGMQLGGGCASGTLFALGGGNLRLLVTLAFFIVGSAFGAAHLDFWRALPAWPAVTSQDILGWPLALLLHLAVFGALMYVIPPATKAKASEPAKSVVEAVLNKPWPLLWGATGLAALNGATLVLAGRPWGETSGFTLWASKIALAFGIDAAQWPYWRDNPGPLTANVFSDVTTVMDFGIIIGALLASALSQRFHVRPVGGFNSWVAASSGGMLMGYGARLSDGCNIGAYFSALASGSVSAWVWVAAAFVGSWIGLRIRSAIRLH